MACRCTAPLDDDGDVACGKLGGLERADDLEPYRIAETYEDASGLAIGARRQHPRRCRCDRVRILGSVSSYVSLPGGRVGDGNRPRARSSSSTAVEVALPRCDREHAA